VASNSGSVDGVLSTYTGGSQGAQTVASMHSLSNSNGTNSDLVARVMTPPLVSGQRCKPAATGKIADFFVCLVFLWVLQLRLSSFSRESLVRSSKCSLLFRIFNLQRACFATSCRATKGTMGTAAATTRPAEEPMAARR